MQFQQKALAKAVVYFKDDNSRTFYSRDQKGPGSLPNIEVGINRLKKMGYNWKDKIRTAMIYDNKTGQLICKFKDGQWVQ